MRQANEVPFLITDVISILAHLSLTRLDRVVIQGSFPWVFVIETVKLFSGRISPTPQRIP